MIKRLCLMVGCSVQRASQKIKRRMAVVCQTGCNSVLKLVRLVVRIHPGAPNTKTLLALCTAFMLGIASNHYIQKGDKPPVYALEEFLTEKVAEMDCGMLFEIVDFEEVAHVKDGAVYKGMWTYGFKLSLGPVPVHFTPEQRREYHFCGITTGMGLMKDGYKDGDVMRLKSRVELWKLDDGNWMLDTFEAAKNE